MSLSTVKYQVGEATSLSAPSKAFTNQLYVALGSLLRGMAEVSEGEILSRTGWPEICN